MFNMYSINLIMVIDYKNKWLENIISKQTVELEITSKNLNFIGNFPE